MYIVKYVTICAYTVITMHIYIYIVTICTYTLITIHIYIYIVGSNS